MVQSCISGLLAGTLGLIGATQAVGQQVCRPALEFKETRFSETNPRTMERKWTAVLSVDASRCATTSGRFGIVFTRAKEDAPEVDFAEQFMWKSTVVEASIDFWADEAVERYRLDDVAACPCRGD